MTVSDTQNTTDRGPADFDHVVDGWPKGRDVRARKTIEEVGS